MLPTIHQLCEQLRLVIEGKRAQGHSVAGLHDELDALPPSYDALAQFAARLASLPLREDWPYVEPNDLDAIWAECDPDRPTGLVGQNSPEENARRVEVAFLSSVCGCILGAYFGPEGLDERWLAPFNDDLRTGLARFYERSLGKVARRMGKLPGLVAEETASSRQDGANCALICQPLRPDH